MLTLAKVYYMSDHGSISGIKSFGLFTAQAHHSPTAMDF